MIVIGGVVLFALGRCSADPPLSTSTPASALLTPVEAPVSESSSLAATDDVVPAPPPIVEAAAADPNASTFASDDDDGEMFSSAGGGFSCSGKRYCREMDSCAEANFYLNQCGVGRIDGDGDGVPCESIC